MSIRALRLLPPLAIGRFGSSSTPLEAYELIESPEGPLDFRQLDPRETLEIDPKSGAVARKYTPQPGEIVFKDADGRIRPVAPFLEVFAETTDDRLVPLTLDLLAAEGLG